MYGRNPSGGKKQYLGLIEAMKKQYYQIWRLVLNAPIVEWPALVLF
jgi:hypothetical protein